MANLYLNFRSDDLSRSVYPVVFLPDFSGWNDRKPPYPTLYFLPGYSGGALETATFTNFSMFASLYGIAIVMVDGENSFYVDDETRGAMFSHYVGQEIVQATRVLLPLSHKREDTFIGGISMGGYGALINGLRFSDTFSKIMMLSPALGLKNEQNRHAAESPVPDGELLGTMGAWEDYAGTYKDYAYIADQAAKNKTLMPELFLAHGREDFLVKQPCEDFLHQMRRNGVSVTYYEDAGGHDHAFWKKALTPACEFLTMKRGI